MKTFFDLYQLGKSLLPWENNSKVLDFINDQILNNTFSKTGPYIIIEVLLKRVSGVDLNQRNYSGVLPLHLACYHGKIDIVSLLIEYGADVNEKSKCPFIEIEDVKTLPIHFALLGDLADIPSTLELVTLLLESGSELNDGFFSPLILSIVNRADTISELLIQHGADINETDPQGNIHF